MHLIAIMGLGLACVTAHAVAQEVDNDDSADLVKSIMDDTYGQNYDARKPKDVSTIAQVSKATSGVEYAVSAKEAPAAKHFFPLHVIKSSKGVQTEEFDTAFDSTTLTYALPADR